MYFKVLIEPIYDSRLNNSIESVKVSYEQRLQEKIKFKKKIIHECVFFTSSEV